MSAFERLCLAGRVIIVTGGGGGIGEATAILLGSRGAAVVVVDTNDAQGDQVASAIRQSGGRASYIRADISREDDVAATVQFAISEFGGLHGAFNNAAIVGQSGPLTELNLDNWHRVIGVNQTGVYLCMKHQIAHMLENGGGAIVNTSSSLGVVALPNSAEYTASKHGVVGLTRVAALENARRGIRVNAVLPSGIETPMLMGAMERDPALRQAVEQGHPIGRLGNPMEIAEGVAWLLSDSASFVTGACLSIDGGYTCV